MCNEIENKSNDYVDDSDLLEKYGDNTNREVKDSFFKIVFGEHPENALSLYNAVNNTHYTNIEDLSIKILRDAMYIGIRNDVSFLFNHELCLYEHQSSLCGNMPMRGLEYFVDLIKINLSSRGITRRMLFSTSTIPLPTPKYYVFYNGPNKSFERREMHLSDAYEGAGDIEVTAHIINVNVGHNKEMMSISKPLADYAEVIHRVQEYTAACSYNKEQAVADAIDSCIADGILADILKEERGRVMLTMIGGPTAEEFREVLEYDREVAMKLAEEARKNLEEVEKNLEEVEKNLEEVEKNLEEVEKNLEEAEKNLEEAGNESRKAKAEKAEILRMYDYLVEQERFEDMVRVTKDEEFRRTILAEMAGTIPE